MPPAIPIATYRLQLTPQFTFDDAATIVPYLKSLGISHVYASPFLKARSGSMHGYDIVDHGALNPEFGGEAAFARLSEALAAADMGLILDFVPNHMAVHAADNAWWLDVLEWGPRSRYAKFFDIDWDTRTGQPRVLLPILGRPYGEALESGEIELRYDPSDGTFSAWFFEHRLPIGPNRYGEILQKVVATAGAAAEPAGRALLALAAQYRGPRNPGPDKAPSFKHAIADVPGGADIIMRGLAAYRPGPDQPGAVLALHYLLERQHYRPAYWRLSLSDINYRRFFDINTLAGLCVEEPSVFKAVHPLVLRLIGEGRLHGLRLDHIDGLRNPHQYLRRLQRDIQVAGAKRPFYVVIEKILAEDEPLPRFPGIAGTTGYEWLNVISRVLLDGRGLPRLDQVWRETTTSARDFDTVLRQSKQRVLSTILSSEFAVLAQLLARIAAGHYSTRDYAPQRLQEALELYVLNLPIYRTYVTGTGLSEADRAVIRATIEKARAEWFGPDVGIFDFLSDALSMDLIAGEQAHHSTTRVRRFAFKVQQFTGPLTAKSLEDTSFYRYHRLLALNEVGGNPASGELPVERFHALMAARAKTAPHGLTATATHDTKRGEDARARLLALSELPDEWAENVSRWRALNAPVLASLKSRPTAEHEYMLYQTLLGAWPLSGINHTFMERMQAYAVKAAREGKERTSWIAPDERYEAALKDFIAAILDRQRASEFIESFDSLARRTTLLGALNSLTQTALKLTMPGVPDLYQGTEFWDLSLVDPDNRRPVDYRVREQSLASAEPTDWAALARTWDDGRIKLALIHSLLALRAELPRLFADGEYRPVTVSGPDRDSLIAFSRTHHDSAVVVVAARHFARATQAGTTWPTGTAWNASVELNRFRSVRSAMSGNRPFSGPRVPAGNLLVPLPVAILRAERMHPRPRETLPRKQTAEAPQ